MAIFPAPTPSMFASGGAAKPPLRPKVVPLTDEQVAAQQVKAAFDPILNNLTNQYNARGDAQARAITGSTDELARLMGGYGPTAASAYDRAASNEAAVNSVLAATRQGQGADASAALAGKLGGIDGGTAARVNGGLTGDLAGESLASATKGANNLAMLLGQGASAADFGAKLPGIAGGIGLNANRTAQGQITNELSTQLQALAAQEPKAVQDALGAIQSNKAKNAQLSFENSLKNAEFGLASNKAKTSAAQGNARIAQGNARIGVEQQNANTSAARAADSSARGWASIGIREKAAQAKAQADEKKLKSGGFTASQVQRFKGTALTLAQNVYDGFTDSKNVVHKPLTYQQAVLEGRKEGLPVSIITASLNQFYKPGERGRPTAPLVISPKARTTAPTKKTVGSLKKVGGAFGG